MPRPGQGLLAIDDSRKSNRGLIRPIYAAVFDLEPSSYGGVCNVVLDWLRSHRTVRAFASEMHGSNFDINRLAQEGTLAQAATSPLGDITVVRLQHRHHDEERKPDLMRNWRTEVTVEHDSDRAWMAVKQSYVCAPTDLSPVRTPPRFIKELWKENKLSDLDVFQMECRRVEYDVEADDVADLIKDEDRDFSVVVMADGCPLDAERIAIDSLGFAHVFKLSRDARFRLTRNLGEKSNLLHGALQTFYPIVHGGQDMVAPAARFETIMRWQYSGLEGPGAFAKWMHDELGNSVVARLVNDPAHRSYEEIRMQEIRTQREALKSYSEDMVKLQESLKLANEDRDFWQLEKDDFQQQIAELKERSEAYLNERKSFEQAYRKELERNRSLQCDKVNLQYALIQKNGSDKVLLNMEEVENLIEQQPEQNTVLDAIEQAEHLFSAYGVRVRFSEKAKESAMEACAFKRPGDVLAALIRLGFLWNDIRGSGQRLDEAARQSIRFPVSTFESKTTMGKYGSQRDLHIDGKTVRLLKHIKLGGGGIDDSARIYFGDKDGELLIGHVGRHLDVAKTQ